MFADWAPVPNPTDAVAGRPSSSLSQPPATSSTTLAAGEDVALNASWSQPMASDVRGGGRRQRPADDEPEEAGTRRADQPGLGGRDEQVQYPVGRGGLQWQRPAERGPQRLPVDRPGDRPIGQPGPELDRRLGGGSDQVGHRPGLVRHWRIHSLGWSMTWLSTADAAPVIAAASRTSATRTCMADHGAAAPDPAAPVRCRAPAARPTPRTGHRGPPFSTSIRLTALAIAVPSARDPMSKAATAAGSPSAAARCRWLAGRLEIHSGSAHQRVLAGVLLQAAGRPAPAPRDRRDR